MPDLETRPEIIPHSPVLHGRFRSMAEEERRDPTRDPRKYSEWLHFIHEMETTLPGIATGRGIFMDTTYNGDVELAECYPDFRVLFRKDHTVSIVSATQEGSDTMLAAAKHLGIHIGGMA